MAFPRSYHFFKLCRIAIYILWFWTLLLVCFHERNQSHPDMKFKSNHWIQKEDLYISVKTTSKNVQKRLQVILDTWYQLAPEVIYFTTDKITNPIETVNQKHLKGTDCKTSHSLEDLLCKTQAEFRGFFAVMDQKKWFCHFDDDNYVNTFALMKKLTEFDADQDWYLGKVSWIKPFDSVKGKKFWFGTGGAGFCLSKPLVVKMMPYIQYQFMKLGKELKLPDDVLVGYIVEYLLKVPITVVDQFHSHLEPQKNVPINNQTISYSYSISRRKNNDNILDIPDMPGIFEDPTRFKTLHAKLFPATK